MKLQLDTENKTIKLEESVKLNDLFETLEKLLPNELWKEFKLDIFPITNMLWTTYPIYIIEKYKPIEYPWITPNINPQYPYTISKYENTSGSTSFNNTLTKGIFNVQC